MIVSDSQPIVVTSMVLEIMFINIFLFEIRGNLRLFFEGFQ